MPDRGSIICEGCEAPKNRGKDLKDLSGLSSQRKRMALDHTGLLGL